jgi:hypothetical protein
MSYWIYGKRFNHDQIIKKTNNSFRFCYINKYPQKIGTKKKLTNDIGWSCTIRSVQMILANTIKDITVGSAEDRELNDKHIVYQFYDINGQYSIHNIFKHLNPRGYEEGKYLGIHEVAYMVDEISNETNDQMKYDIHFVSNGVIPYTKYKTEIKPDKPSIILMSHRFCEGDHITDEYQEFIAKLFKFSQFSGFVGGSANKSFFFYGAHETIDDNDDDTDDRTMNNGNNVSYSYLYLDPHWIMNFDKDYNQHMDQFSMNTDELNELESKDLDPNVTLGFYYHSENEYKKLIEFLETNKLVFVEREELTIDDLEEW